MRTQDKMARSQEIAAKVATLMQKRAKVAQEKYKERLKAAASIAVDEKQPVPLTPWDAWTAWSKYAVDVAQRSVLFLDTMRERGNNFLEHTQKGLPPVLHFEFEMVLDARFFDHPVNYALVRIV